MDLNGIGLTTMTTAADRDLRMYARWEYGSADGAWLARTAAAGGRGPGLGPRIRRRVREWLAVVRRPVPAPEIPAED